jgi:uncharacterized protein (TIRG00374 family)
MQKIVKAASLAINVAILAGFIVWGVRSVSLDNLLLSFSAIQINAVMAALALNLSLFVLYAARLSRLLKNRFLDSLGTVTLGFGLNGLLPFRLGEVAKIAYANRLYGIATGALAAATVVEKLFDLGSLTLLGTWLVRTPRFSFAGNAILITFLLLIFGATLLAFFLWFTQRLKRSHEERFLQIWAPAVTVLRQRSTTDVVVVVILTSLIWLATNGMIFSIFSYGIPNFGISDAVVLCLIIALAIAVPGTPAGLGIVEAGITGYLLQVFDTSIDQALALSVVYRLITSGPQIVLAIAIIGWSTVRRSAKQQSSSE